MAEKQTYKNPQVGKALITTISTGCRTPLLEIKFSTLHKPFYYPNSQTIPRYSVTVLVDPAKNKEFLLGIKTIEKNEGVETIIKNDTIKENGEHLTTGKVLLKFQSKDLIPIYKQEGESNSDLITLEDELARGEKIMVVYNILRYTKKNTMQEEHGITFKPTAIYWYPAETKGKKETA